MALEALVKLLKKLELKGTYPIELEIQSHAMLGAMRKMMAELERDMYKVREIQAQLGAQNIAGIQEQLGNSINADILAKLGRA